MIFFDDNLSPFVRGLVKQVRSIVSLIFKKTLILKMAVVDVEIEICKTGNLKSAVD